MRQIDTDALRLVAPSLGVGNPATVVQPVDLDDGVLQQTYVVNNMVRRAAVAPVLNEGMVQMVARTIHTAAESISVFWSPIGIASSFDQHGEWPRFDLRSKKLELWLLSCALRRTDGAGDMTDARFQLTTGDMPGIAIATGGATFDPSPILYPLAYWDTMATQGLCLAPDGQVLQKLNMRFPLDHHDVPQTSFALSVATDGAAEFTLRVMCGLFPRGMGQDAAF